MKKKTVSVGKDWFEIEIVIGLGKENTYEWKRIQS